MPKTIAIMQPTYLPWLGYLSMIERVDQFVFLDNVQFDHRSWQQRNKIKTPQGELLLTISVRQKERSFQKINEVQCISLEETLQKHLSSLKHSYKKAKNFDNFYMHFSEFLNRSLCGFENSLASMNMEIIKFLCRYAGIEHNFLKSSELSSPGKKGELLANICEELGGSVYLSPPGSKEYLEDCPDFSKKNIQVAYHHYKHPIYPQLFGDFISNMSAVDAFFNVEQQNLKPLIRSGCA